MLVIRYAWGYFEGFWQVLSWLQFEPYRASMASMVDLADFILFVAGIKDEILVEM